MLAPRTLFPAPLLPLAQAEALSLVTDGVNVISIETGRFDSVHLYVEPGETSLATVLMVDLEPFMATAKSVYIKFSERATPSGAIPTLLEHGFDFFRYLDGMLIYYKCCLLYTSPSPRD